MMSGSGAGAASVNQSERRIDALESTGPRSFEDGVTNARLANELLRYICPAGEPWTADHPEQDHGHTDCMWIGLAIQRLRRHPDETG